ncbi:hypothetical protein [Staphylococcus succinus]|uniref:hypothetical protein n=1 Tax=Staphylococcus succinus TaxID=61015 RepID=UPI00301D01A7
MNNPTEIKYPLDEYGQPYFAATHAQAIQGVEELATGGWIPFTPDGGKPNTAFQVEGDGGYTCAYREIKLLGISIKSVRLNLSETGTNLNIAVLPTDFAKNAQSWTVRTPTNRYPAVVTLRPNGKLAMAINRADTETWLPTDYIYGEHTWIE